MNKSLFLVVLCCTVFITSCSWLNSPAAPSALIYSTSTTEKSNAIPERLFLQQISSHSVIIKWRGEASTACILNQQHKPHCLTAKATDGDHREVLFQQLQADTDYLYSVGSYSDETLHFRTAPITGKTTNQPKLRMWILGDSGTASEIDQKGNMPHPHEAKAVMEGFLAYNQQQQNNYLNMILLLGDNAYSEGTDAQWQTSVFDLYRPLLTQTALWPTIGNHEMGAGMFDVPDHGKVTMGGLSISASPDSFYSLDDSSPKRMPYLDIFSLPTNAQTGGVASGTEQYYAFNYGNIHVVSLDSQLSARQETQRNAMREWLIADLGSNQQDWTIVIFHHPPYTRGSHDSDTATASRFGVDTPIIDMREEFTPVFEDYGVDMVYSGHSHSYERSYYLNGHRGDANTFNAAVHAELSTQGQPATGRDQQPYPQISANSKQDDKVVYTVAGSSGKVSLGKGKLDHPAHAIQPHDAEKRRGLAELGSVLLETSANELSALFINEKGQVLDKVTITR